MMKVKHIHVVNSIYQQPEQGKRRPEEGKVAG